jgi:hypothetical protein
MWLKPVGACKLSFVHWLKIQLFRRHLHGICRPLNVFKRYFNENKSIYEAFIKLRERKDTGN